MEFGLKEVIAAVVLVLGTWTFVTGYIKHKERQAKKWDAATKAKWIGMNNPPWEKSVISAWSAVYEKKMSRESDLSTADVLVLLKASLPEPSYHRDFRAWAENQKLKKYRKKTDRDYNLYRHLTERVNGGVPRPTFKDAFHGGQFNWDYAVWFAIDHKVRFNTAVLAAVQECISGGNFPHITLIFNADGTYKTWRDDNRPLNIEYRS